MLLITSERSLQNSLCFVSKVVLVLIWNFLKTIQNYYFKSYKLLFQRLWLYNITVFSICQRVFGNFWEKFYILFLVQKLQGIKTKKACHFYFQWHACLITFIPTVLSKLKYIRKIWRNLPSAQKRSTDRSPGSALRLMRLAHQFYFIIYCPYQHLPFTLRTKQRKIPQYCCLQQLQTGFTAANRAEYPFFHIIHLRHLFSNK